jgi:putative hydrolase of the HAD superfamily
MALLGAVFFDLDETLLADNKSYEVSITRVCEELAGSLPAFSLDTLVDQYRLESEAYWLEIADSVMNGTLDGQSVRLETWRRVLQSCSCDDDSLAAMALASYSRHRRESYTLFEDAPSILDWLSRRLPVGLITNGSSDTQWEKIRRLGLDTLIKTCLVSGDVGVAKPDPAIFRLAIDKLGVAPEHAWHVGDSLFSDVGGAKATGLTAIWLNREGTTRPDDAPVPDYEIRSLAELESLLADEADPHPGPLPGRERGPDGPSRVDW